MLYKLSAQSKSSLLPCILYYQALPQTISFSSINLHNQFPNNAWLKILNFLIPKPFAYNNVLAIFQSTKWFKFSPHNMRILQSLKLWPNRSNYQIILLYIIIYFSNLRRSGLCAETMVGLIGVSLIESAMTLPIIRAALFVTCVCVKFSS